MEAGRSLGLWDGKGAMQVVFPAGANDFCLFRTVQTGPVAALSAGEVRLQRAGLTM